MKTVFKRALALVLSAALSVSGFGGTTKAGVVEAEGNTIKYDYAPNFSTVFENFITVDGTKLMDGDKELKFVSLNYPQATSDTAWESENAVKTIKAMGGNVTRSYTIPVYNGQNSATAYVTGVDENGQLTFNEDALNSLDHLLDACNRHGIRLIIPLVDHWHWIGGMDGYVWLAGEADGTPTQSGFQDWAWEFYSSEKCMDYFKQMITHLLNRTNSVTGVKYMDDPAILCWETGNEVGNRSQDELDEVLSKWTNEVANHIRSIYGDTTIPYEITSEETKTEEVVTQKAMAVADTIEEVTTEEATTEEITTEEVTTEEAVTEEVVTEEVVTEEVVTEEVATEEVATEEVVTEEATTEETIIEEIIAVAAIREEVIIEETITEEVATEEAVTEEAVTEEAAAEEVATEEVATEEAVTEKVATEEAVTEEAVTEEAVTEEVATEEVVTEEVATEEVTTEEVITEKAMTKKVITEDSTATNSEETAETTIVRRHLILDGRMSMSQKGSLAANNPCDILGAHYYEGNYAERCKNDTIAAHNAGKPFILGEFGGKVEAKPCIDVFQQGLENGTNGIMMWSLRAHKDGFGYYFHDEDGFWAAYHWPGFESGDYYGETEILRALFAYAQIANGKADTYEEARKIKIPAPETEEAPLLYAAGSANEHDKSFLDGSVGDIKWRGVVGGAWYEIQRTDGVATEDSVWTTIADEEDYVYDSGRNWEDKAHDCIAGYHDETAVDGKTYSYRLRACNESGAGLWSNIVTVNNTKHVVVDELDLIAVSSTDANPTEIRRTYSSDHSANISYSSSSIVNQSKTEGYIEYEAIIPVKDVVVTAINETEEGNEPKIFVSADGISYKQLEAAHTAGTKEYSVSNVSNAENYYYTRIYIAGESACKLDTISITYQNDGNSYRGELGGAGVNTNVMIQDNTFGINAAPYYTFKSTNLTAATGNYDGITTTDAENATILYKTGDDINAYRIVAYTKDGVMPKVEYSYDGVTYADAAEIANVADGDYTKVTFGDLNVSQTVRVIRVTFPEGSRDKVILKSVELSSGTKFIPLAESAPANTLEDGEYYFGLDENIVAEYTINGNESKVVYTNTLANADFTVYDCVYAWVKPDNSGNTLNLQLTDADGTVWTSTDVVLNGTTGVMNKFLFGENKDFDFSKVVKVEFVISAAATAGSATGTIALNADNFYTGNYGVALNYDFDGVANTVYVDSVYVGSSTKADDFEGYSGSNALLQAAYAVNAGGGTFDMSLDPVHKSEGSYGARIDYNYNGKGYAGAVKQMDKLNLAGYDGFTLYIESDGSGNQFKLQMTDELTTYNYTGYLFGKGPMIYYVPFADIVEADWTGGTSHIDGKVDLKTVEIYTNQEGSVTSGTFYIDDIKGANFTTDLAAQTAITLNEPADGGNVTAFPYTISGTAAYVDYVTVVIGDKMYNVAVNEDGTWSYELTAESGVYNGTEVEVKAGVYYPNKTVVKETAAKMTINVDGNDAPIVESYDTVIWDWDFATDSTEGWEFEGFTPKTEADSSTGNTNLVAWSQTAYDAVFSYKVTGIPNGIYTLQNDIKVKSNMNNVQMALSDGTNEVKSKPVDTQDVFVEDQFLGEKFEVTNNEVIVKYYVSAPDDATGSTFAVGDIKLYLVEGANIITNGDFTEVATYPDGWVKYPTGWDVTPYDNSGNIKTDAKWDDPGNNRVMVVAAGTEFSLSQKVSVSATDAGIYSLSVDVDTVSNPCAVENFTMKVLDAEGKEVGKQKVENGTCTLDGLALPEGIYTVQIAGTMTEDTTPDDANGPVVYIDNVKLVMSELGVETPDTDVVWAWDFADGTEGWKFEGFTPKTEADGSTGNTNLVAWSQDGYDAVFSYTVKDIPNGVYTLQNDIRVKSNVTEAYMALSDGVNEVKTAHIDTSDIMVEDKVMEETFAVTNNQVTVKYYAKAPADTDGATFIVGDIKLRLTEGLDVITNGDFTEVTTYPDGWVKYPTGWDVTPYDNSGNIKTDAKWDDAGNNRIMVVTAGTAFSLSQKVTITGNDAGTYALSVDVDTVSNPCTVENFVMQVVDATGAVVGKQNVVNGACTLTNLALTEGEYTVTIAGTMTEDATPDDANGPVVYIDNVSLVMTAPAKGETPEPTPEPSPEPDKPEVPEIVIPEEGMWIAPIADQIFTGKVIVPEIKVYDNGELLEVNKDYTVKIKNNKKVGTATVTVKGKGNYEGSDTATFKIIKKDLGTDGIVVDYKDSLVETGKNQKALTKITYATNGKSIKLGSKDYTVVYYKYENVSGNSVIPEDATALKQVKTAGDYQMVITGKGNYEGTVVKDIKVYAKGKVTDISKLTVKIEGKKSYSVVCDGTAQEPKVGVFSGKKSIDSKCYNVEYSDTTNVGTATITITGKVEEGYIGKVTKTFKITATKLSKVAKIDDTKWAANVDFNAATGEAVQAGGMIIAKNAESGYSFVEGTDYIVTYSKNKKAGKATAFYKGIGKYTGTIKKTFKVNAVELFANNAAKEGVAVNGIADASGNSATAVFAKKGSRLDVTVTINGNELVEGVDYKVSYKRNKAVTKENMAENKKPQVTIQGINGYKGKLSTTFVITPASLEDMNMTVADVAYQNKKGKYVSAPVLTDADGAKLKANKDYTVTYYLLEGDEEIKLTKSDVVEAYSQVKVVATAKSTNYKDSNEKVYTVAVQDIAKAKVVVKSKPYTGKKVTLTAEDFTTIKVGDTKLKEGVHYEIVADSYENNINKGKASVTIKGIGNYAGTKKVTFKITGRAMAWVQNLFKW